MHNPYNTSLSQFLALEHTKMSEEQKAEHEKEVQRRLVARTLSEGSGKSTETADSTRMISVRTSETEESQSKEPDSTEKTETDAFEFTMDEDDDEDEMEDEILNQKSSPQLDAVPLVPPPFKKELSNEKIQFLVDSDDEVED